MKGLSTNPLFGARIKKTLDLGKEIEQSELAWMKTTLSPLNQEVIEKFQKQNNLSKPEVQKFYGNTFQLLPKATAKAFQSLNQSLTNVLIVGDLDQTDFCRYHIKPSSDGLGFLHIKIVRLLTVSQGLNLKETIELCKDDFSLVVPRLEARRFEKCLKTHAHVEEVPFHKEQIKVRLKHPTNSNLNFDRYTSAVLEAYGLKGLKQSDQTITEDALLLQSLLYSYSIAVDITKGP